LIGVHILPHRLPVQSAECQSHGYVSVRYAFQRIYRSTLQWCRLRLHSPVPSDHDYRIAGNTHGVQILFFSFSVYQDENLTHETYVMMGIFSCVNWTEKIKHTNQLEIVQNEIWTQQKFPATQYWQKSHWIDVMRVGYSSRQSNNTSTCEGNSMYVASLKCNGEQSYTNHIN